jgi:diamine N-acetyltransferase
LAWTIKKKAKVHLVTSTTTKDIEKQVTLRSVSSDNWRGVAKVKVTPAQREFVAEPCYYLALCCYGDIWQPLAVCLAEQVIGLMMWGVDPADGSCWLGGITIDQNYQGRGYGKQAVQAAIAMLSQEHGCQHFALSYNPVNPARELYHALGFVETAEMEAEEVVARLSRTT